MKTKITMFIALLFAITINANSQGMQRMTVEERVKATMDKMTTPLSLDTAEQSKTAAVFTDFYTAQNKMREDARASGTRPDRSVFEKMMNDRDDKLKAIFTDEQYKKYKDGVEATLRPQRPQGGGGTQ
jgi:periplasmic protein CpxP/Spy